MQYGSSGFCCHTFEKTVFGRALAFFGLVGSFWHTEVPLEFSL